MENIWRLESKIGVLKFKSTKNDKVLIVPIDINEKSLNKLLNSYQLLLDKKTVVKINNSNLNIKFELSDNNTDLKSNINLFVKFNSEEIWYEVINANIKCVNGIITQSSLIENGEVKSSSFEAAFSQFEDTVSFISSEMKEYGDAIEELERRLNCEIYKKTKKWIPGHRYDSVIETVYYLCPVSCLLDKKGETIPDYKAEEGFVYVTELNKEFKTISEVLKNNSFGNQKYGLKVAYSMKSLVDSGEVLKDDYSGNFSDYYQDIINNYSNNNNKLQTILVTLGYFTNTFSIPENIEDVFIKEFKNLSIKVLESNWDKSIYIPGPDGGRISLNNELSDESILVYLKKLILSNISGSLTIRNHEIRNSESYTSNLMNKFDFSKLDNELKNIISEWKKDLDVIYTDFSVYLKRLHYTKRNNNRFVFDERNKTLRNNYNKDYLKNHFSDELSDFIINMIKIAEESFGKNIDNYNTCNVGTKNKPLIYVNCIITIENILSYIKEKGVEMSESLKNEIMKNKITEIDIIFDKDSEIQ